MSQTEYDRVHVADLEPDRLTVGRFDYHRYNGTYILELSDGSTRTIGPFFKGGEKTIWGKTVPIDTPEPKAEHETLRKLTDDQVVIDIVRKVVFGKPRVYTESATRCAERVLARLKEAGVLRSAPVAQPEPAKPVSKLTEDQLIEIIRKEIDCWSWGDKTCAVSVLARLKEAGAFEPVAAQPEPAKDVLDLSVRKYATQVHVQSSDTGIKLSVTFNDGSTESTTKLGRFASMLLPNIKAPVVKPDRSVRATKDETLLHDLKVEEPHTYARSADGMLVRTEAPKPLLTPAQTNIMIWIAMGHTQREIAIGEGISVRTVKEHTSRILEKIGGRNKADITCYYLATCSGTTKANSFKKAIERATRASEVSGQ